MSTLKWLARNSVSPLSLIRGAYHSKGRRPLLDSRLSRGMIQRCIAPNLRRKNQHIRSLLSLDTLLKKDYRVGSISPRRQIVELVKKIRSRRFCSPWKEVTSNLCIITHHAPCSLPAVLPFSDRPSAFTWQRLLLNGAKPPAWKSLRHFLSFPVFSPGLFQSALSWRY